MISIHAAREGGDMDTSFGFLQNSLFQSTPPVKAATALYASSFLRSCISIHAAREGGDFKPEDTENVVPYFNPRRP